MLENTRKNKPGTSININENTAFVLVDMISAAALQQRIAGRSLRGFWFPPQWYSRREMLSR
jgi:hypothetical protein